MKRKISLVLVFLTVISLLTSCTIISSISREITIGKYKEPIIFINTDPSRVTSTTPPLPPPNPWDNSLYMMGRIDSGIVESGKNIDLKLKIGANDNVLSGGDLHIVFDTKDYALTKGGERIENNTYIIPDFFEKGNYTKDEAVTLSLIPTYTDYASGAIEMWVRFVPDDMEEFINKYQEELFIDIERALSDGYISLDGAAIAYSADSVETWLSSGTSYGNVFHDMSTYHYEGGLITTEEMAKIYFGYSYNDRVCSGIFDYDEQAHTMAIFYYSKNIRYESNIKIKDSILEEDINEQEEFWNTNHYLPAKAGLDGTKRVLEIMRENGVLTEEEYNTELLLLDEVLGVYTGLYYSTPGTMSNYDEVNKLRLTHFD